MVEIKDFEYIDRGDIEFEAIKSNFKNVGRVVSKLEEDVAFLYKRPPTVTRTILIESEAVYTLMKPDDHPTGRITEAMIMAADNLKIDQTIKIVNGSKDLVEQKTLKSTEKSGKVQSLAVRKHLIVHRKDEVSIISTSHRKTVVTIVYEGEKQK